MTAYRHVVGRVGEHELGLKASISCSQAIGALTQHRAADAFPTAEITTASDPRRSGSTSCMTSASSEVEPASIPSINRSISGASNPVSDTSNSICSSDR
jgi:hypothetical protein